MAHTCNHHYNHHGLNASIKNTGKQEEGDEWITLVVIIITTVVSVVIIG
jgi:hypothetical protein